MATHPVLVTGAYGQFGTELARAAWPAGWQVVAIARDMLDLADPAAITAIVAAGHGEGLSQRSSMVSLIRGR